MRRTELRELQEAVIAYVKSEGCDCCRDYDAHKEAKGKLGKLLKFEKYDDGSGYNFYELPKKRRGLK